MSKQNLKNMIIVAVGNKFGFAKELVQMIDENIDTVFVANVSEEFLEKQGIWTVTRSNGKATKIKDVLPLYTVDTFNILMQFGLTHEYLDKEHKGFLLNHMIQYKRELPWGLLDYVYEDGLAKGQNYNVNAMLSLVENVENARWLLSKGARCCTIPGYGQTFGHMFTSAIVSGNRDILNLVIKEQKVDYDWLTTVNEDGFLNIDTEIIYCGNHIQAVYMLQELLKDKRIIDAKKEWRKTASMRCLNELSKIQSEFEELLGTEGLNL